MPRLRVSILLATALFLVPASAEAHRHSAHHPHASSRTHRRASAPRVGPDELASHDPVVRATAVAKRYWGAVPCHDQITVLANRPLAPGLEPTTDAWVTFNSSLGTNDLEASASTYTHCVISLAHWQWSSRAEMEGDWNMLCLTVIHELGHLLGHPHSLIPGSVMAPVFTSESNVPPICRATEPSR